MTIAILNGDCGTVDLEPESYDAMLSDCPYGLEFMGKQWDKVVPQRETWEHLAKALKPGAYCLIFGGTRTFDLLCTQLRAANFEIRDTICWLYGSGFPKSLDVSKALDKQAGATREVIGSRTLGGNAALSCKEKGGTYASNTSSNGKTIEVPITAPSSELAKQWEDYGTALKPAWEPIIVARKPLDGTVAHNVQEHGCGALNIGGTRIGRDPNDASGWSQTGSQASANVAMSGKNYDRQAKPDAPKRFPANLILDAEAAEALDRQTGKSKSQPYRENIATGNVLPFKRRTAGGYSDEGGASRFFYCTKASKAERGPDNNHPTLKPIKLTEYLALLLLPPTEDARLLIPFSGSGSEIIGARNAGWKNITGIERELEYITIAKRRLENR